MKYKFKITTRRKTSTGIAVHNYGEVIAETASQAKQIFCTQTKYANIASVKAVKNPPTKI